MVDAIFDGKLKAMYLYGEEMTLVDANANLPLSGTKPDWQIIQEIANRFNFPDGKARLYRSIACS
jgi:predicted molibdopterin-dependent oxidoreductase YjgC